MPDQLVVDYEALIAASNALTAQAGDVPLTTPDLVTLSGCGDSGVISAGNGWAMWAAITVMTLKNDIESVAGHAASAAAAFQQADTELGGTV